MTVLFFKSPEASKSPVQKEYIKGTTFEERAKIDAVLDSIRTNGLEYKIGFRLEQLKGIREPIFEIKIKAFGTEHRFLAYRLKQEDNSLILFLLKYVKKKEWRLRPDDIETAVSRYQ
ncbi:MAG: hypothetical protein HYY07_02060, partial [Elusimicrobia bacterium]|nr:hypothetical protein [Elusimicrobiota bacterium]